MYPAPPVPPPFRRGKRKTLMELDAEARQLESRLRCRPRSSGQGQCGGGEVPPTGSSGQGRCGGGGGGGEEEDHNGDMAGNEELEVMEQQEVMPMPSERRLRLNGEQRMIYIANFIMHFGVSGEMMKHLEGLCRVTAPGAPVLPISSLMKRFVAEQLEPYGYLKMCYCNGCQKPLRDQQALCANEQCVLYRAPLKRTKLGKRITLHTLLLAPQLKMILKENIDALIAVHESIHRTGNQAGNATKRAEVTDYPLYRESMESYSEFFGRKLNVQLTLNFDGVRFKKFSRSEAWPIYMRLEGLPFTLKNKAENTLIAAVLFTRRAPKESLLAELFSRAKAELVTLFEAGLPVEDGLRRTWSCYPVITNAIMDFQAIKLLFNCPRWQTVQGCHLCRFQFKRLGRRVIFFAASPRVEDRRTADSIMRDALLKEHGLLGPTQMMSLITMDRCRPDALHVISEGITCDLLREMLSSSSKIAPLRVAVENTQRLSRALERCVNYTYASKFILGIGDLRTCTGAEKDVISFIVLPLAGAMDLCAKAYASVGILAYWIVVRLLQGSTSLAAHDLEILRRIAQGMKFIWRHISETLFTLKVHCFIDHSILEDMSSCGSVYQWTASGFESIHRRLQLRVAQGTTNCEEMIVKNFLLKKNIVHALHREAAKTGHRDLMALSDLVGRVKKRFPCSKKLSAQWYFPVGSFVDFSSLEGPDQLLLRRFYREEGCSLSSRLVRDHGSHLEAYCSTKYRRRTTDSAQSCVQLILGNETVFGDVIVFIYEETGNTCSVLLDEFLLEDPFLRLAETIARDVSCPCRERCVNTLSLVQSQNRFFKRIVGKRVALRPAFDISSAAVTVNFDDHLFVSQI